MNCSTRKMPKAEHCGKKFARMGLMMFLIGKYFLNFLSKIYSRPRLNFTEIPYSIRMVEIEILCLLRSSMFYRNFKAPLSKWWKLRVHTYLKTDWGGHFGRKTASSFKYFLNYAHYAPKK